MFLMMSRFQPRSPLPHPKLLLLLLLLLLLPQPSTTSPSQKELKGRPHRQLGPP